MNIKRHRDRLDVLLTKYEQEIREAEEKLRVLKTGRSHLTLLAQGLERPAAPQPEPDKSRDPGITKTILETVTDLWRMRKDAVPLAED